ncbi:MAG: outer membrane lipoprotein-sorting protein [Candidatus Cloacimonetes bacterium]|jgi:outer membrane lipoprotein-sorting protein|nr:outer membrane lipoprotein-sorting protein [Candidatus Cloacimonadota bacterium]MDD4223364.1 outer membrane lipoprotein-sorting protein [Candidatus Cloacimonadota bacterium]
MNKILLAILILAALPLWAADPDPASILKAVDANLTFSSSYSVTRMVINGRRSSRTVESVNYAQGEDKFFTEYTAPPRDKGTKMLKLGDKLWIYDPGTDRSVQISGNMLKQSVMGSDLSYEDFMEASKLQDDYSASLEGSASYDGRDCWVLLLTAKKTGLAYSSARIQVDKARNVILHEQLFAKSGKLLKTIRFGNVKKVGGRWYPHFVNFKDELKSGKGTEYYVDEIRFDLSIPAATFTKAMLKK